MSHPLSRSCRATTPPPARSRLITTRETLGAGMAGKAPNPTDLYETKLDRKQFGELVRRLSGELGDEHAYCLAV